MAEIKVYEFNVEMTCEGCSGAVERVLGKLKGQGVENVEINMPDQKVCVKASLTSDELLAVLKKTGKTISFIGVK